MPTATVSTQTHWSWLADLAEISRLSREANHSFSLSHQDIQQRTRQVQAHEDQPGDDRPPTPGTPVERGSRGRSEEGPAASPLSSPAPSIPSHPVGGDGDELACACADEPRPSSSKKDTGAALFGEFEQLQFGLGDSERSTDSEEESQDSSKHGHSPRVAMLSFDRETSHNYANITNVTCCMQMLQWMKKKKS